MTSNEQGLIAKRLRFLFKDKITGAWGSEPSEDNAVFCIRAADLVTGTIHHVQTDLTERSYSDDDIEKRALREGDILIEKSGGGENQPVGRIALFSLEATALCSNFLQALRPDEKLLYPRFGAYLLLSLWLRRLVIPAVKQTTGIQNLDIGAYLDISVEIPSVLTQQRRIAAYLDRETARIDDLIRAKERLIKLLEEKRRALITRAVTKGLDPSAPMKPSGVDWLGEVPVGWGVVYHKHIVKAVRSGVSVNAQDIPAGEGYAGVLKTSCVKEGEFYPRENKTVVGDELDRVSCPAISDTIIMSRMNTPALVGQCGYVIDNHPNLYLPDRLWQISYEEWVNVKFYNYFFSSTVGQFALSANATGTSGSMKNISKESMLNIKVPYPPESVQASIVTVLDQEYKEIAGILKKTVQTIELLKERRSALISAAVTGQLEIPES